MKLEQDEREKTGIKGLKVGFNRVFGYYIEVTKSNYDQVPDRYIRKQTLTNAERFITEELKNLENQILGAEEKVINLEYNEFVKIREEIEKNIKRIQTTAEVIATLDVLTSFATVAEDLNYSEPIVDNSGVIDDTIWKVFSPSMALIDVESSMEDYSCVMFPALRALEGYLYYLLDEIGETITLHRIVGNLFQVDPNDPNQFLMKRNPSANANRKGPQYKPALEEVYTYFNKHRHVSFHMSQIFIDTKVISNKQEAIDTVNEVADLIERTFAATHP